MVAVGLAGEVRTFHGLSLDDALERAVGVCRPGHGVRVPSGIDGFRSEQRRRAGDEELRELDVGDGVPHLDGVLDERHRHLADGCAGIGYPVDALANRPFDRRRDVLAEEFVGDPDGERIECGWVRDRVGERAAVVCEDIENARGGVCVGRERPDVVQRVGEFDDAVDEVRDGAREIFTTTEDIVAEADR